MPAGRPKNPNTPRRRSLTMMVREDVYLAAKEAALQERTTVTRTVEALLSKWTEKVLRKHNKREE
jgi:hypothetical protein